MTATLPFALGGGVVALTVEVDICIDDICNVNERVEK